MKRRTAEETAAYLAGYEAGRKVGRAPVSGSNVRDERGTPTSVGEMRDRRPEAVAVAQEPRPVTSSAFCPICKLDTPCEHYDYQATAPVAQEPKSGAGAQPASSEGRSAKVAELRREYESRTPIAHMHNRYWVEQSFVERALALLSEREADAQRYRWLQDRIDYFGSSDGLQYARLNFAFGPISLTPAQLDAAIDAALAEKGP